MGSNGVKGLDAGVAEFAFWAVYDTKGTASKPSACCACYHCPAEDRGAAVFVPYMHGQKRKL
eukprot:6187831-Pleurochrysis_carterae.AAC.1